MAKGQTSDQQRLDREGRRERREALLARQDTAAVMASPAGRRLMYRLVFETCGLQDVYLAQDSGIYKHEGKRGIGAAIVQDLQTHHAEAYILMLTERMRDLKYDAQIRDDPQSTGEDQ